MKNFFICSALFLIIAPSMLAQSYSQFDLGVHIEQEDFTGIGASVGYGVTNKIKTINSKNPRANRSSSLTTSFDGVNLKYIKNLNQFGGKLEFTAVRSRVLILGLAMNWIQLNDKEYYGIKPIVGISLFNFNLFYGYNFILSAKRDINKNNIGLYYRINFKKKHASRQ